MRSTLVLVMVNLFLFSTLCSKPRQLPDAFQMDLQTVEGQQTKLADFAEKPILLIFWTRGCESCAEISHEASAALKTKKIGEVILVSVDAEMNATEVTKTASTMGLVGTLILDPELKLVQALEIESHPALLLITPSGNTVKLQKEYDLSGAAIDRTRNLLNNIAKSE